MKLLEYEAKQIFAEGGIPTPAHHLIDDPSAARDAADRLGGRVVLKAQVDVGGRGKAGGILRADAGNAPDVAEDLFSRTIKGVPVHSVLVEEELPIEQEFYLSVAIDRSAKQPVILFAEAGGVDIEEAGRAVRSITVSPLLDAVPPFQLRELLQGAPTGSGNIVNALYRVFRNRDALLAEINPLVSTPDGLFAADAKLIIDDNALARQGIEVNRDLSQRELEAERHGFSFVELEGSIGVIGNGAGLTMSTLDLIVHHQGTPANFLDVGGGADRERVMHAVRLVAGVPGVRVILVNLLGGITRCDEVAQGIIDAGVDAVVIVRLAGTNEEEGRDLLSRHGYRMLDTMEEAVQAAVEEAS